MCTGRICFGLDLADVNWIPLEISRLIIGARRELSFNLNAMRRFICIDPAVPADQGLNQPIRLSQIMHIGPALCQRIGKGVLSNTGSGGHCMKAVLLQDSLQFPEAIVETAVPIQYHRNDGCPAAVYLSYVCLL